MIAPANTHEHYMREALKEAYIAFEKGEIPVGAVMVCENKIIARGHNQTEVLTDATAHAEMITITSGANYLGAKYLQDCTLYVTLEPCVMCAGASYWSQLGTLVYGATDEKRGFTRINTPLLHPKTRIITGVLAQEASQLVVKFFEKLRN